MSLPLGVLGLLYVHSRHNTEAVTSCLHRLQKVCKVMNLVRNTQGPSLPACNTTESGAPRRTLAGRTIVLFGDSVARQQFFALACMIDTSLADCGLASRKLPGLPNTTTRLRSGAVVDFNVHWSLTVKSTTIRLYEVCSGHICRMNYTHMLEAELAVLKSRDIVITGQYGVRLNNANQATAYMGNMANATVSAFARAARDRLTCRRGELPRPAPALVWQEVTPQHWPTANGWYTPSCGLARQCKCAPLTALRRKGTQDATGNGSDALYGVPAGMRNRLSLDIIRAANLKVSSIYTQLSNNETLHISDRDCTHWSPSALIYMAQDFICHAMSPAPPQWTHCRKEKDATKWT